MKFKDEFLSSIKDFFKATFAAVESMHQSTAQFIFNG